MTRNRSLLHFSAVFSFSVALLSVSSFGHASPSVEPQRVCELLKHYPRQVGEKLSFEDGLASEISPLCQPFITEKRKDLDRCGNVDKDPFTSHYTWPSRNEVARAGKINLFTDSASLAELPKVYRRIETLRGAAAEMCCGSDEACRGELNKVTVGLCKPSVDPNHPDPCVFGGSFHMPGSGYTAIFKALENSRGKEVSRVDMTSGEITLSSYVSKRLGAAAVEPILMHEFGHACSMARMKIAALDHTDTEITRAKADRARDYLKRAKNRCDADYAYPEAYTDFWESLGEPKEVAQCLRNLATVNQKQQVDGACPSLCPGHYLEESVGIAFSLLTGRLNGGPGAVFPNTCNHTRDGQHPLVSDVVECLAQNSPRFREKMKTAYGCL